MVADPRRVRPTKRCLADLDIDPPDLGTPLGEIDNPIITSAQALPEQRDAGGVERIISLTDRVWFKVKTTDRRAAATPNSLAEYQRANTSGQSTPPLISRRD